MEIQEIIETLGGARKTAELVGVSFQAVYKWKRIPPQHVLTVAAELEVDPYDLRPDVFPKPEAA